VEPSNFKWNSGVTWHFTLQCCCVAQQNSSVHWWLDDLGSHLVEHTKQYQVTYSKQYTKYLHQHNTNIIPVLNLYDLIYRHHAVSPNAKQRSTETISNMQHSKYSIWRLLVIISKSTNSNNGKALHDLRFSWQSRFKLWFSGLCCHVVMW